MFVSVDKLKHHPLNKEIYNLSSIDELVESISEVGLLIPLTIDQSFQVISGNRRLEAIRKLGWDEVEVNQINVAPEDESLLLIHFNKQRVKTTKELLNEYDILKKYYGKKQGERTDLTSVQLDKGSSRDVIGGEIGVSSGHLARILYIRKHHKELIELIDKGYFTVNQAYLQVKRSKKEDEYLSSEKVIVQPTQNDWEFYHKSSDRMEEVDDESIQTIFTSPPYWKKRKYSKNDGLGNENSSEEFVHNLSNHLKDCKRVLKSSGSFFLNLGDTFYNGNLQNIPHRVVLKLQENEWILRNTIIWSKSNPKPSSSKSNLTPSYEFIFHLVKSLDYDYHPTLTTLEQPSKPTFPPRHRNLNTDKISFSPYIPNYKGKNMGDFWNEEIVRTAVANQPKLNGIEHPAPFPEQIIVLPILQTSKIGDTVLDPFCGTGTVGKVCDEFDRSFIGYDLNIDLNTSQK